MTTISKKFRFLTLSLIFSGALNIGLLAAFLFSSLRDSQDFLSVSSPFRGERKEEATNSQLFSTMSRLSFRELVSFLTNRDLVEEGFAKRDLAVAALVAFHHFNLEKALGVPPAQKRTFVAGEQKVDLFLGLTEEQFEAIIRFAYQEKWPLTAKGLFRLLQNWDKSRDESLEQAFLMTPEFYSLQVFFQKSGAQQEAGTLFKLVSEGSWDLLERFAKEQSQMLDFSIEKRRGLLLSYLALHSQTAAELLLKTDFVFALKRLEDRGILDLLSLLKKQSDEAVRFCVELLRAPRSDAIWQAAAMTLYSYAGELPTAPVDPKAVLARFAPSASQEAKAIPASTPAPTPVVKSQTSSHFHIVKEGESLWKIARQYKVKVDEIVRLNELEKDALFPGMTLKLPQGSAQ